MDLAYKIAELLDFLVFYSPQPPYWIEIKTRNPSCTYYFGHFNSPLAAELMKQGYIQDLIDEDAIVVSVKTKQCQPDNLTIYETDNDEEYQV